MFHQTEPGKWVMRLDGGSGLKQLLIPDEGRATLCVSSSDWLYLGLQFCSTGKQDSIETCLHMKSSARFGSLYGHSGEWDRTKENRSPML